MPWKRSNAAAMCAEAELNNPAISAGGTQGLGHTISPTVNSSWVPSGLCVSKAHLEMGDWQPVVTQLLTSSKRH